MNAHCAPCKTVGVLAAAALLLVGCGSGDSSPAESPTPSQGSGSPTPSEGSGSPSPVAAIDPSMLLPAPEMPPWNGAIVWQEAEVDDLAFPSPACDLPSPEALGAAEHASAHYAADAAMTGSNTIMLFPDESTAAAALASLEAAMPDCLGRGASQGPITDDEGASSWTGSRDCTFTGDPACDSNSMLFEFIGVGARDNTATIVSYGLIGQDANYCLDPDICPEPRDPVLPEVYASLERMQ